METNLKQIHLEPSWVPIGSFTYRGISVDFYEDCLGHQVVAPWRGKVIEFGEYNTVYQDDMKMIIDDYLDTITRFSEYPEFHGSKLEYFQNGNFRDIRLMYRGRLLKCFLIRGTVDKDKIIEESIQLLKTFRY